MQYGNGNRRVVLASAAAAAALMVTGCEPGGEAEDGITDWEPAPTTTSAPACPSTGVEATVRQAADRPDGTGTGAAVVEFTNVSATSCVLTGHPTVAGAGNGSPEHNAPLKVTPTGTAAPVAVAPGGKAWVKLTFVQVQGEADGYCESGADPVTYPTLVVGLRGSGSHQVALDDGVFAECDNEVTVTPVSAVRPS